MAGGQFFSGDQFEMNESYVLLGNGDGTFQGAPVTAVSFNGTNLADVNGDGKLDLVTQGNDSNGNTDISISLGNGDGTFATPTLTAMSDGGDNQWPGGRWIGSSLTCSSAAGFGAKAFEIAS